MDRGSNICRTCLSEKSEMYSLFTYTELKSDKAILNFANMLEGSMSIQIAADDGLPNHICKTCCKILNLTYSFKQQCTEADIWLHEHFIRNHVPTVAQENLAETIDKIENPNVPVNDNVQIIKKKQTVAQATSDNSLCVSKLEVKKPSEKHYSSKFLEQVNEKKNQTFLKFELPDGFEVCDDSNNKLITSYQCLKCNKISKNKHQFDSHQQSHRSHICKLCSRSFRSGHGLSYHMKQHQGIKKFVCTYENCNKSFIMKQGLDKHQTLHNAEKNYLCSRCGKSYYTRDSLSYHLKTHAGERPHLCTYCGKTFKQACHLNTHMWNHTGVKPYLCSTCGKRYTTSHHLKKHIFKNCGSGVRTSKSSTKVKGPLKIGNAEQEKNNQQSTEISVKVKKLQKIQNLQKEATDQQSVEIDYFQNEDEIMLVIEEIDTKNS